MTKTILILGGTAEAADLARRLQSWPGLRVVTSLAGRTRTPDPLPGEVRIGGFGGVDGLARYLGEQAIDVLIDATHPFAERISRHAVLAARSMALPRLRLARSPWAKRLGDQWIEVDEIASAAKALPGLASRVFLTSGHRDLAAFADLDDIWFLIRTIEPVTGPRPRHVLNITGRGPFDEAGEVALLQEHHIEALVTKASGGSATYAKIAAARRLGLPVVMIGRPPPPPGPLVCDTGAAQTWLRQVTA